MLKPSTYQIRPALSQTFKGNDIKAIIHEALEETLQGKIYNTDEAVKWTREISDAVSAAVKDLEMPRYKHVVQVMLGQQLGEGCRYIAKCCWDAESDSHTTDVFSSASLFCVCSVFGVYLY